MNTNRILFAGSLALVFCAGMFTWACTATKSPTTPAWPEITHETKPWTRWWWHGSTVNPTDLTANLEEL